MSDQNCHSSSRLDWAYAHFILRLWVGLRLFMAGIDKMREKGGPGFGWSYVEKSMAPIVDVMQNNSILPAFAIKPYATVLPIALLVCGIWSILGIFTRTGLLLSGLVFISLSVGLMALPDDDQVVQRGIEVAITGLALMTAAHNKLSLDGLLFKKGGSCCAHKSAE